MVGRLQIYEDLLHEISASQDGATQARIDRALERVRRFRTLLSKSIAHTMSRKLSRMMTRYCQ